MANKYKIRPFETINNKTYQFYEASVNGKFLFEEFCKGLKDAARDKKKLSSIYAYMDMLGPQVMLPKTKFRCIGDKTLPNLFEFKKGDIRVYVIKQKPSVYIVLGGYKGRQDLDIERVKNLFKDFKI